MSPVAVVGTVSSKYGIMSLLLIFIFRFYYLTWGLSWSLDGGSNICLYRGVVWCRGLSFFFGTSCREGEEEVAMILPGRMRVYFLY